MKTIRLKALLIWALALFTYFLPQIGQAQITDDTQLLETPITGKGVFYLSVLASDLDENGTMDALVGLSQGQISGYSSISCIVRFSSANGYVDAHNGSSYGFDVNNAVALPDFVTQPEGEKYEVWFEVDVAAGRYTPWVKGPDMTDPVKILDNVEFRAKGVASLDRWTAVHQNGGDKGLEIYTVGLVDSVGDRHPSYDEASIADVTFTPAGLNGNWDPDVTSYTATFPFGTTSTELSATPVQHGTSISNLGTLNVTSGSGQITLEATSESGTTAKTYTIDWNVNDPSKDATLSSLTVDVGDSVNFAGLTPAFGPTKTEYTITVPYGTEQVVINAAASAASQGATVSGVGTVKLVGGVGMATIVVTSSDQTTTRTYTVEVLEQEFNITGITVDATLFNGTVQNVYFGIFEKGVSYVKDLPAGTISISNLNITTNDPDAIIETPSNMTLVNGEFSHVFTVIPRNLKEIVSYPITFRVKPNAAPTNSGKFDPILDGTHVIYAKISAPSQYNADGLFALSSNFMSEYPQFSAGFRFVNGLPIQLHNGGYAATEGNPNMAYDTAYHCWMAVDMVNKTYSVYYTVQGETDRYTVGENAVFRNSSDSTASQWGAYRNNNAGYTELNVMKVELVSKVGDIPSQGADATLAGITLSNGMLNETFSPSTLTYTATIPSGVTTVNVSAEPTDPAALVIGEGAVSLDAQGLGADTITVYSDNGAVSQQYIVKFTTTAADKDVSLSEIRPTDKEVISYAVNDKDKTVGVIVPFRMDSIHLEAIAYSPTATITGDGVIKLTSSVTSSSIVVTSGDQSVTDTWTVTISKEAASNDATLSHLAASNGVFDLTFDPTVMNYELIVDFGTESVDIWYLTNQIGASVTGAGTIDLTGLQEKTVSLLVTAEDGSTTKTYSIRILVGGPSNDATLKDITLSTGTLSPTFDPDVFAYTVDVIYGTTEVIVTGVVNQEGAEVAGDGAIDVTSGSGTATILVTAEDDTQLTYSVVITVLPGSDDATLSSLSVQNATLEPAFDPAVLEYVAVVPLGTATANITAVKNDVNAQVTGAGALDVISGSGVANVVVTSETGAATNTYVVTVYVGSKPKEEVLSAEDLRELVEIYPNPVVDQLNINLNARVQDAKISVLNIEGKLVHTMELDKASAALNLSGLAKGLYLIQIESEGLVFTQKLVKE